MRGDKLLENTYNIVPLSSGYMLTSIIAFLISVFFIYPINKPWGFTFSLFFFIMFVASMISMTYAPGEWPFPSKKPVGKNQKIRR